MQVSEECVTYINITSANFVYVCIFNLNFTPTVCLRFKQRVPRTVTLIDEQLCAQVRRPLTDPVDDLGRPCVNGRQGKHLSTFTRNPGVVR